MTPPGGETGPSTMRLVMLVVLGVVAACGVLGTCAFVGLLVLQALMGPAS